MKVEIKKIFAECGYNNGIHYLTINEITTLYKYIESLEDKINKLENELTIKKDITEDKSILLYDLKLQNKISTRTQRGLSKNNIDTLAQLHKTPLEEIRKFRYLGEKAFQEIIKIKFNYEMGSRVDCQRV